MAKQQVIVLFGGRSGEHEVSVVSAKSVITALDTDRWDVVPLAVGQDGGWLSPDETSLTLASGATSFPTGTPFMEATPAQQALAACDVVLPLIHGTNGEDGTLQGLLEMAGVAYAGAGVAASAIGMDKALMKALFRDAEIPVANYAVLRSWEWKGSEELSRGFVGETIGFPCFVKPANGGSSVGVSKARSGEDLDAALQAAFAYDDKAVIEEAIDGQEVEVAVIGNEEPQASIAGEIVPDREFYDYSSKYAGDSTTELRIPAAIDGVTAERVRELAVRMYEAMGCEGFARVDFFVRNGNEVIANEVNTIPGFTSISMFPKLWEATGLGYSDLLTRILELGLERHARRSKR